MNLLIFDVAASTFNCNSIQCQIVLSQTMHISHSESALEELVRYHDSGKTRLHLINFGTQSRNAESSHNRLAYNYFFHGTLISVRTTSSTLISSSVHKTVSSDSQNNRRLITGHDVLRALTMHTVVWNVTQSTDVWEEHNWLQVQDPQSRTHLAAYFLLVSWSD
jgi:hypothetical protein